MGKCGLVPGGWSDQFMVRQPEDDDALWQEALSLVVKWQADPENKTLRRKVQTWCSRSPEHRLAWDDARRVWNLTGRATGAPAGVSRPVRKKRVTRRRVLTGLGAVAAGGALLRGPDLWRRWQADFHTGIAELTEKQLADGTRMTLGPDSAVRLAFGGAERRVELLSGMAFFEVAPEPRVFRAVAGELTATALGTAFELRSDGDRFTVGVDRGAVSVAAGEARGIVTVSAQEWVALDETDGAFERGRLDISQTASWREGKLIADRQPVRSLVAEIARWQSARVLVPEPSLANARVSGLFDLSDPQAALEAVVVPHGGHVRRVTPWLTILTTL